ncbi:hypothetical protein Q5762_15445 [Streptomyces sp. P9(2023)]|uniref:hypothetical protein n=1 Tax=Streptomyces sp. P9(2023) TaxID=3064394 RepID=UPI0028F45361|nr:hypothetical protein [Streptomyces sp. P9(2023)]MDT9689707.1 hypothetical protein [Streptomyces sp. P9(2023)]
MSYSERWQELFGPADGGPAMNLASTAPEPSTGGPGAGTLQHSGGPWTKASGTSADLRTSTETSRVALGRGHEGVSAGATGFASAASLTSVLKSWEERLTAVRDECDQLEGALLKVAKEMGETDIAVEQSLKPAEKAEEKR